MNAPRSIEIPARIQPIIRMLHQRAQWSDERVASFTAETLIEIQRCLTQHQARVKGICRSFLEGVPEFSIDAREMIVVENGGEGRTWNIPDDLRSEIAHIVAEIEVCTEAAKLAGLPAMTIIEKTQSSLGEINRIIHDNIPQCATGDWRIDLRNMTMNEVLEAPTSEKKGDPS